MPDADSFERAQAAAARARTLLSGDLNVVSVGVGTKQVAGAPTETWCVSVSVHTKLPPAQLPAGALIPADIDGVPTDVVETGAIGPLLIDPKDKLESYELNTYRPLRGGIKLGIAYASTAGIEPDLPDYGTLGCVVRTNDTPPRHVALTNWHVIAHVLPNGPVGQPHSLPGSTCCGSTEVIGNVFAIAHDTFTPPSPNILPVDVALCSINEGLEWIAGIGSDGRGPSTPFDRIAGTRDLKQKAPPPPKNLPVKKRGARTGLTKGHVANFEDAKQITVGTRIFNGFESPAPPYYLSLPVLKIQADITGQVAITGATKAKPCVLTAPGHGFTIGNTVYVFDVVGMTELNARGYKVGAAPAGSLTLLDLTGAPFDTTGFTAYAGGGKVGLFTPFALPGDSGSVVCDMNDNIVGVLFGGNLGLGAAAKLPAGAIAYACHVEDVIAAMGIAVPLTATTPGVQKVPANNNPFKAVTASPVNAMAKLQNDLLDTEHGVAIARAMMTHEGEVRTLIRTNARIAARWRHVADSRLVDSFVAALFEPDLPVAGAMAFDAKRALHRFADALARYASTRLREDLGLLRDLIIAMVDLTYRDIVFSLKSHAGSLLQDRTVAPAEQIRHAADATMGAIATLLEARMRVGDRR